MKRIATALLALTAAMQVGLVQAQEFFRVDGLRHPVPAELSEQWDEIQNKESWETVRGRTIQGSLEGFEVRQYEILPASDEEDGGPDARVRVTWFRRDECRRVMRPIADLDQERQQVLERIFGEGYADTDERLVQQVVFARIGRGGRRETEGQGDDESDSEGRERRPRGDDETEGDGIGSEDDTETEGEERQRPPGPARFPVRFLAESDRGLVRPFARIARESFLRRLATADCSRRRGNDDEQDDETPDGDDETERDREERDRGDDEERDREDRDRDDDEERDRDREDRDPNEDDEDRDREESDDDQDDEEEGDDEEGDDDEQGPGRRFGFHVRKFVAAAGSLEFELDREFDVCIRATSPRDAITRMRGRFRPRVDESTSERISYRFRPNPQACRNGGNRERGEGDDEESEDDGELEPVPDPLNTEADEIEDAFPLIDLE